MGWESEVEVDGSRAVYYGAIGVCVCVREDGGRSTRTNRGETVDLCSVLARNVLFVKMLPPPRKPLPRIRTRLRGNLARY